MGATYGSSIGSVETTLHNLYHTTEPENKRGHNINTLEPQIPPHRTPLFQKVHTKKVHAEQSHVRAVTATPRIHAHIQARSYQATPANPCHLEMPSAYQPSLTGALPHYALQQYVSAPCLSMRWTYQVAAALHPSAQLPLYEKHPPTSNSQRQHRQPRFAQPESTQSTRPFPIAAAPPPTPLLLTRT